MITLDGTNGITNDGGYTGDGVVFADTTPTNTLVTTTGGNVGIGTSSPLAKFVVSNAGAQSIEFGYSAGLSANFMQSINRPGGADVDMVHYLAGSGAHRFYTNATERARIDSSGNFLMGKTADTNSVAGTVITLVDAGGAGKHGKIKVTNTVGTGQYILEGLNASGGTVGGVITTSTATSFSTSSDYRLKENIAPMTGALAKVALLKPCTYKWKVDGSEGQGFIAHELQEVEPGCVTGEKDAVDADGNPKYQGIDTSFLVATLAAAIQELKAIVDAQGAEIAALKGTQP